LTGNITGPGGLTKDGPGTLELTANNSAFNGNLTVANGALLNDHDFSTASVTVEGNVKVGKGAVLGLGSYNPFSGQHTTVAGNIVATQPLSLYLSFMTVHGNLISNGGGGGVTGEFRNYPTKDITVDGNMVIQGWTGGWIGVIRDHVRGNLVFSNNRSVINGLVDPPVPGVVDSDSSEIMTQRGRRQLDLPANTPAAQVNPDDGGQPNTVGGQKIGQCAGR
jgi:autotransporter-associated beta strand protein